MPRKGGTTGTPRPAPGQPCGECGQEHITSRGHASCMGHKRFDRDPQSPTYRARLAKPLPCGRAPRSGLDRCKWHGAGNQASKAAADQRVAADKAEKAILAKLGDSGQPITDPIATLCSIAGRAVRFMELIGAQVDQLEHLRLGGDKVNEVRAEIALYERSMGRAATVVESLIRMGIAERLAKVEEEQTAAIVKFIDGVLTDLGHNPRAPEVAGVVARRLELVS